MLRNTLSRLRRDRRGFTLVETLVAMVTGLIVTGALFAILEVSMSQSSRLSDVAQATQLGRSAMNRVVDAMHSACVYEKATPVQEKSSPSKLILISGYGEEAEVPVKATSTTGVQKDEFAWEEANKRLVDSNSLSLSETTTGVYTWGSAKSVRLGENIEQVEVSKKKEPIFRYFEYATTASTSTSAASSTLKEITEFKGTGGTLEATQAKKVAAVSVEFRQLPTDKSEKLGRPVVLNSQATFAFAAPDAEATISAGPCE